jgi:ABC-type uncharacterized transport system ATPase subunit
MLAAAKDGVIDYVFSEGVAGADYPPTRGLDEGAVAAVHVQILASPAAGAGVLLVSEDLDEVLALADRVQAMVKGRVSPPVPVEELDAPRLGRMMVGLWEELV